MKFVKVRGLCLAGLGFMSVFAFALGGSASAAPLLFVPTKGFPYHMAGTGGASVLETVGGTEVTSTQSDVLTLALTSTLFDLHIEFLKAKADGTACKNDGKSEAILVNLLGHLGFADPGAVPGVLLLVPSGFEFECAFGIAKEKVRGSVIGTITAPGLGKASEEMTVSFKQSKGKQEFTEFLLGSTLLTSQFEESSLDGSEFEQSGQSGEATLKALLGQGTFSLVSP